MPMGPCGMPGAPMWRSNAQGCTMTVLVKLLDKADQGQGGCWHRPHMDCPGEACCAATSSLSELEESQQATGDPEAEPTQHSKCEATTAHQWQVQWLHCRRDKVDTKGRVCALSGPVPAPRTPRVAYQAHPRAAIASQQVKTPHFAAAGSVCDSKVSTRDETPRRFAPPAKRHITMLINSACSRISANLCCNCNSTFTCRTTSAHKPGKLQPRQCR